MTVKKLIEQLQAMPQDLQVKDTYGSPIYWMAKKPKGAVPNGKGVYLEPISEMDIENELDALFEVYEAHQIEEYDIFLDLGDRGFTLEDFEDTKYYEMAKKYSETHDWEAER